MIQQRQLLNFINGAWQRARGSEKLEVENPATGETLARVPMTARDDVDDAIRAAQAAFPGWRNTPALDRVQYLFRLKSLLEEHSEEIARLTTQECGKTLAEARGELQRGIENVGVATGIPSLMMGYTSEDIARGIDEYMLRQPVGVVAAITPF